VDHLFNQAVAAGATVTMPLANQFWGDRYGQITDPFGHRWAWDSMWKTLRPKRWSAAPRKLSRTCETAPTK